MIIHIIKTIVLMALYCVIWQKLEKKMYREITHRNVDDVIMILLIPVFWLATR